MTVPVYKKMMTPRRDRVSRARNKVGPDLRSSNVGGSRKAPEVAPPHFHAQPELDNAQLNDNHEPTARRRRRSGSPQVLKRLEEERRLGDSDKPSWRLAHSKPQPELNQKQQQRQRLDETAAGLN